MSGAAIPNEMLVDRLIHLVAQDGADRLADESAITRMPSEARKHAVNPAGGVTRPV
jgi:hypothetical protein